RHGAATGHMASQRQASSYHRNSTHSYRAQTVTVWQLGGALRVIAFWHDINRSIAVHLPLVRDVSEACVTAVRPWPALLALAAQDCESPSKNAHLSWVDFAPITIGRKSISGTRGAQS
ncbi:MAG: hypothetical protein ACT6QU_18340, partial [Aliihoeflea sp.]|uniref:hypothetical protein n=1 Tax=Aliihoeflea sp. TaxID=2608088 RepID=UPI0040382558